MATDVCPACGRRKPGPKSKDPVRDRSIARLLAKGCTLADIADRFGLSRTRVSQIAKRLQG
jgi:DNA-binding CsgD family transcriptional regulator